jgi:hypothetical protein
MRDVFIAHVEEDADIALEVVLGLEEVGYTTWCYEVDSIPGQSYLIQTGKAVEDSRVAVVVISPHSLGSRQVTREVVRAHESGKEFIPVLRGITHVEFQNRQPEWREAIGAAASISIPREGVARVIPRIIDGLKSLGILPTSKTNAARIVQIRETLAEIRGGDVGEKAEELPTRAKRIEARAVTVGKPPTISGWFWAAIALLCLGFLLLIIATIAYPSPINPQQPWYEYFFGILIIAILFIVPGVYCLRRGMSQATVAKPSQGKIPSWWWLWPIILAFVGGIISWAKQKDVDWRKAANMLTLGIVLSLFWTIPFLILQAPVVPAIPSLDTTQSVISKVNVARYTGESAMITWETEEGAIGQVEYGTTDAYGKLEASDGELTTSHSVELTGLQPNTTYHFRVKAKDGEGNEAESGDHTFATWVAEKEWAEYVNQEYGFSVKYPSDWVERPELVTSPSHLAVFGVVDYTPGISIVAVDADAPISADWLVASYQEMGNSNVKILSPLTETILADGTKATTYKANYIAASGYEVTSFGLDTDKGDKRIRLVGWAVEEFSRYDEAIFSQIAHTLRFTAE